jgi:hypothetical protein
MNHLEQLVSEWLQYNGYYVKVSIAVGARPKGGFEGELDVVGLDLFHKRLLHVECSLDALAGEQREKRFSAKFERGQRYMKDVFKGWKFPLRSSRLRCSNFTAVASDRLEEQDLFLCEI